MTVLYQRRESEMAYLKDHQEFGDEAFVLINSYVEKHGIDFSYGCAAVEVMVRHLLHWESLGHRFTPEQRDYYIETCMGIIPLDKEYERQIGYFGQSNAA